jgi:glutamyl-tRNA reductase
LKRILQKRKNIDDETIKSMELLTKSIVNKLIHPHVAIIKENGSPIILELMKKLFKLEDEDEQDMDSWHEG